LCVSCVYGTTMLICYLYFTYWSMLFIEYMHILIVFIHHTCYVRGEWYYTVKNCEKIMRKRQKIVPKIIRQFWQKYSHFEKILENFLSFSSKFLMIFVSVRDIPLKRGKGEGSFSFRKSGNIHSENQFFWYLKHILIFHFF